VLDVLGRPSQGRILQQRPDPAHGGSGDRGSGSARLRFGSGPRAGRVSVRLGPARPSEAVRPSPPSHPCPGGVSKAWPIGLSRRPNAANGRAQTTPGEPIALRPGTWLPSGPAPLTLSVLGTVSCFPRPRGRPSHARSLPAPASLGRAPS
jgi:hypothetical protein